MAMRAQLLDVAASRKARCKRTERANSLGPTPMFSTKARCMWRVVTPIRAASSSTRTSSWSSRRAAWRARRAEAGSNARGSRRAKARAMPSSTCGRLGETWSSRHSSRAEVPQRSSSATYRSVSSRAATPSNGLAHPGSRSSTIATTKPLASFSIARVRVPTTVRSAGRPPSGTRKTSEVRPSGRRSTGRVRPRPGATVRTLSTKRGSEDVAPRPAVAFVTHSLSRAAAVRSSPWGQAG